jgi:hypothetical protein
MIWRGNEPFAEYHDLAANTAGLLDVLVSYEHMQRAFSCLDLRDMVGGSGKGDRVHLL